MKKLLNLKIIVPFLLAGVLLSCKKNESTTVESDYTNDTIETAVDTIGPATDTTDLNGAGTTGATGEGSTGSGTAGSTQKGNTNVANDTVKK